MSASSRGRDSFGFTAVQCDVWLMFACPVQEVAVEKREVSRDAATRWMVVSMACIGELNQLWISDLFSYSFKT